MVVVVVLLFFSRRGARVGLVLPAVLRRVCRAIAAFQKTVFRRRGMWISLIKKVDILQTCVRFW